ncbi:hypothetical protein LZ31DRAFT_601699 [Colletotrichum somersetense]|nr:hypothetical protein LZ31DRAFT_601699 [Colletotrichum somersetense]
MSDHDELQAAEIDCLYPVPEALYNLALATIAAYYIGKYKHNDYLGGEVWSRAQEDFFDWSIDDFELLHRDVVNKLRDCLVERGVWIDRRKNASIARRIYETTYKEERVVWNDEMIETAARSLRELC